jgi:hypothetical protein
MYPQSSRIVKKVLVFRFIKVSRAGPIPVGAWSKIETFEEVLATVRGRTAHEPLPNGERTQTGKK